MSDYPTHAEDLLTPQALADLRRDAQAWRDLQARLAAAHIDANPDLIAELLTLLLDTHPAQPDRTTVADLGHGWHIERVEVRDV
jgi:hypothetical protein